MALTTIPDTEQVRCSDCRQSFHSVDYERCWSCYQIWKEENRYVLCEECGERKHPVKYPTCLPCSGLVLCDRCGDHWHDSDYDQCYECWGGGY